MELKDLLRLVPNDYEYCLHSALGLIPMGEGSVTSPEADDGSTEVIMSAGFRFGNSLHHNIYVGCTKIFMYVQ